MPKCQVAPARGERQWNQPARPSLCARRGSLRATRLSPWCPCSWFSSRIPAPRLRMALQDLIQPLVAVLVPIFFVRMGTEVRLDTLANPAVLVFALVLTLPAMGAAKFSLLATRHSNTDRRASCHLWQMADPDPPLAPPAGLRRPLRSSHRNSRISSRRRSVRIDPSSFLPTLLDPPLSD